MSSTSPIAAQDVIAVRELSVVGETDKVIVQLGRPRMVGAAEAVCPYSYSYRNETVTRQTHGIDTFQALELAWKTLASEIRYDERLPLGKMFAWEIGDDMGFPEFYTDEYFRNRGYDSGNG